MSVNYSIVLHRGIFHASWTDATTGTTRRRSLGTKDQTEAQIRLPALISQMQGQHVASQGTGYTLSAVFDDYERRSGKDSRFVKGGIAKLRPYFSAFRPTQLNDAAWTGYRKFRTAQPMTSAPFKASGRKVSDSTACGELRLMRAVMHWAQRNGWKGLEHVKVTIPKPPRRAVRDWLDREEVKRLLEACVEPHLELFIRLSLATGARMGAVLALRWDQIHWPVGKTKPVTDDKAFYAVNVRPDPLTEVDFDFELRDALRIDFGDDVGNKQKPTGTVSKSNVGLYACLRDAYERRATDYVIEFRGRAPLRDVNLEPVYLRAGLGHKKRRQHLLKKTCASLLVQDGVPLNVVAALLNTSVTMIERHYGYLSPSRLESIGDTLSF